ncbi:MAG: hypothetical protein AB1758_01955 [Candidatus Eremiobacterota bacterium]
MDRSDEDRLRQKLAMLLPGLDERHRRLVLGAEAAALGRGGVAAVARASGVARSTIRAGLQELGQAPGTDERIRRPGGGRKRAREAQPELMEALLASVEALPSFPLCWICKSVRQLTHELNHRGFSSSRQLVADLLREEGFMLHQPGGGRSLPQEELAAQFRRLGNRVLSHQAAGHPAICIRTRGALCPSFAAACVGSWWQEVGRELYPGSSQLLLCIRKSGPGDRSAWEPALRRLATEKGLTITHQQLPPGILKWTRSEDHLAAECTLSLRSGPVRTEVVIQCIGPPESSTARRGQDAGGERQGTAGQPGRLEPEHNCNTSDTCSLQAGGRLHGCLRTAG